MAAPTATHALTPAPRPTLPRLTEEDADWRALHATTVRRLSASLRRYVRDLRHSPHPETLMAGFIARHTRLLAEAYATGHREGAKDYYATVSLKRAPQVGIEGQRAKATLAFYAPSVAKLAREGVQAARATRHVFGEGDGEAVRLAGSGDPLNQWQQSLMVRVNLQADLGWAGMQDGYAQAGGEDEANPYQFLWWTLGSVLTEHCSTCLYLADNSPYDPPGSGGNELFQTPGDGRTDCGAGCKCSLEYGAGDQPNAWAWVTRLPASWRDQWPEGSEPGLLLPARSDAPLLPQQKRALDTFRSAVAVWDAVRGDLPELPEMFAFGEPDEENTPEIAFGQLTHEQERALALAWQALMAWQVATDLGDGAGFSDGEDAGQLLAETAAQPAQQHTGVLVAFFLASDAAEQLALPDGEPVTELHITLAYLGDASAYTFADFERMRQVVALYAATAAPLQGCVSGIGRFNPSPSSDGRAPVYASVDVPGLQEWRAGLVAQLAAVGFEAAADFAYTPHITLAYVDAEAPTPITGVPSVALDLAAVTLAVGGLRQVFPLGGEVLSEADAEDSIKLYNYRHGPDGRFAVGDGIREEGGSGGVHGQGAERSAEYHQSGGGGGSRSRSSEADAPHAPHEHGSIYEALVSGKSVLVRDTSGEGPTAHWVIVPGNHGERGMALQIYDAHRLGRGWTNSPQSRIYARQDRLEELRTSLGDAKMELRGTYDTPKEAFKAAKDTEDGLRARLGDLEHERDNYARYAANAREAEARGERAYHGSHREIAERSETKAAALERSIAFTRKKLDRVVAEDAARVSAKAKVAEEARRAEANKPTEMSREWMAKTQAQRDAEDAAYRAERARMTPEERLQEHAERLRNRLASYEHAGMGEGASAEAMRREIARYEKGDATAPRASRVPKAETLEQKARRLAVDAERQELWMNHGPGTRLTGEPLRRAADRTSAALHKAIDARREYEASQASESAPLRETDSDPDSIKLYNHNHGEGGRFTFSPEGGAHEGEAGGFGGVHGQGAAHSAEHYHSGGGGGGGGGGFRESHDAGEGRTLTYTHPRSREVLAAAIGRDMKPEELANLVGARPGASLDVHGGNVLIHGANGEYEHSVFISSSDEPGQHGPTLFNNGYSEHGDGSARFPPELLAHQVREAGREGFQSIDTKVRRTSRDHIELPELGYDASVGAHLLAETRGGILERPPVSGRMLSDVLAHPAGRAWWTANGLNPHLSFDLAPGSRSRATLNAYLRAHGMEEVPA